MGATEMMTLQGSLFRGDSLRVDRDADGIAVLMFDRQGESVNKFDAQTVEELAKAAAAVAGDRAVRGVLVTSAKSAFIVGADIFEFVTQFAQPESAIRAHVSTQNEAFTAFANLPVPTLTLINGLALGGGFEMALATDARILSTQAQVGLPEVSLGLFPGFGGTVRLPRLVGHGNAIDWICSGRQQNAARALVVGAADEVVPPQALLEAGYARLRGMIGSAEWRQKRVKRAGPFDADPAAAAAARSKLARTAAQQPAASAAVDLLDRASGLEVGPALQLESAAFAQIARTQAASAMIQLFVNDQQLRKRARAHARAARKVERAAVLGAGIMGGGIAFTSASRGVPIVMKDIAQKQLDAGMAEADRLLGRQVETKRLTGEQAREVRQAIDPTLDYQHFEDVQVVIEAVVENLEVKKRVLAEVEKRVRAETIIASNTSSLSISALAQSLERPANFAGMHFFNPVPAMPLVEIIRGPQTGDDAVATLVAYASTMGKTPVVVRECPGFLVNRILTPYMLGFLRAVADGADYQQIDRVMEEFGWPMGPAHLQDVIGMDTLDHVLEVISAGYPARMRMDFPNGVRALVEKKRLGQKSGSGWYRYESGAAGKRLGLADPTLAPILQTLRCRGGDAMADEQITNRLMLPMMLEAVRCLSERIVETPAEVDSSLVLGLGFPRHLGGPLGYIDWLGASQVLGLCDSLSSLGPMYHPPSLLRENAEKGISFYTSGSAS
jgi:3-hydroxyacyl-CoA dehydrogenase/enoyl-CoA hydratase/3-hydroxybutyryl-CoA epimerase/enoyl-CoA isomerase